MSLAMMPNRTTDSRELLRRLWRSGQSYAVICDRMGIGKEAVKGRVQRDPALHPRPPGFKPGAQPVAEQRTCAYVIASLVVVGEPLPVCGEVVEGLGQYCGKHGGRSG